jgi:hypothetical protein
MRITRKPKPTPTDALDALTAQLIMSTDQRLITRKV